MLNSILCFYRVLGKTMYLAQAALLPGDNQHIMILSCLQRQNPKLSYYYNAYFYFTQFG